LRHAGSKQAGPKRRSLQERERKGVTFSKETIRHVQASTACRKREDVMISRISTGNTTHANADAFEALVRDEIFPGLLARNLQGFREAQLLRLARPGQTDFLMLKWFDDLGAVRRYAGDDYERSLYPPKARELLRRIEVKAEHYEVVAVLRV